MADVSDTELAARDLRNRANLFSPDVDHVWAQVARLIGDEAMEDVRGQLLDNTIAEPGAGMTTTEEPTGRRASGSSGSRGSGTADPALFDAEGNHVGFERVDRASVIEDGVARYWMNTQLDARGPLRNRFELGAQFDFGIVDSDENRVYCGPDFYGTGQPYGLFVGRALLLAGVAGRPPDLEPGAARRRHPGLLLGAARRVGRLRGLQRCLQAHLRPRHQPRDPAVRRGLDRRGDRTRPDLAGAPDQGAGRVDRGLRGPRPHPGPDR